MLYFSGNIGLISWSIYLCYFCRYIGLISPACREHSFAGDFPRCLLSHHQRRQQQLPRKLLSFLRIFCIPAQIPYNRCLRCISRKNLENLTSQHFKIGVFSYPLYLRCFVYLRYSQQAGFLHLLFEVPTLNICCAFELVNILEDYIS